MSRRASLPCSTCGDESSYKDFRTAAGFVGGHLCWSIERAGLAGTGSTTFARKMQRKPIQGTHSTDVLNAKRQPIQIKLQLRFSPMTVHPPIGKHKKYPPLSPTVIHAWERGQPEGRKPICWKLITNLHVESGVGD